MHTSASKTSPRGRRLLIAGCGDLGTGLGLAWCEAGGEAFGLRRNAARIPSPIIPVSADLTDPASLGSLPEAVDAIAYIATPERYDALHYRLAYVDGLTNLLAAIPGAGHGGCRLLFTSSTSVHGEDAGELVDETTPPAPRNFSGQLLLQAEQLLDGRDNAVVVRFGGIYGPGRTRLIERARKGQPVSDNPPSWTNRIHRDDCVEVLLHLLTLDTPQRLYIGVDTSPTPLHTVLDWLANAQGLPPPPRSEGGGNQGKRCSSRRLVESGYRFRYPDFKAGYAELLAGMPGAQGRSGV